MINRTFPILSSRDIGQALTFYRDLLGGEVVYQYPDDGPPGYVSVRLGSTSIGLGLDADAAAGASRIALWMYTDDVDSAVERMRAAGTPVLDEPADQPWGERVAKVADPDGNEVFLGQEAAHS